MRDTSLMITPQVSAEQLGAYMEGTLPLDEQVQMQTLIDSDPELNELYTDITTTPVDWSADIYEDYPDFDQSFQLPVVDDADEASNSDADFFNEDVYGDFPEEVAEDENAHLPIDDGDAEAVADNQDDAHFDNDNDIAISDTCNNESSDNFNDDVDYTEGY